MRSAVTGSPIVVLCLTLGCAPDFGGDWEIKNASYQQYADCFGTSGLDFSSGTGIFHKTFQTRDGNDQWTMMQMPVEAYESLRESWLALDHPPAAISVKDFPIQRSTDPESAKGNWPKPDGPAPTWWSPPLSGEWMEHAWWQLQMPNRAMGGEMLYDKQSKTLWLREWNHQWWKL